MKDKKLKKKLKAIKRHIFTLHDAFRLHERLHAEQNAADILPPDVNERFGRHVVLDEDGGLD